MLLRFTHNSGLLKQQYMAIAILDLSIYSNEKAVDTIASTKLEEGRCSIRIRWQHTENITKGVMPVHYGK